MGTTPNVVEGQTIAKWTQDWWTWAVNLPTDANPFTHPDGNFASVNNLGPVFFIAGSLPGGPNASQTHPIDVPFGTPILVPLVVYQDTAPEVTHNKHNQDDFTTSPAIHATENSNVKAVDASITSVFAEINGVPLTGLLQNNQVDSSFFSMGIAQAGTLAVEDLHLADAGTLMDPSRSGGYWLMLDDLLPGTYTLHFGGTTSSGFLEDVTDTINVVGIAPHDHAMPI